MSFILIPWNALRIGLIFLINSQSAAAEDVIESSSVLALFATARKLFVYDHATKKNIVKLYKKQSLKSQNEITISILNQETLSQQWQDARRQANAIWHGDGKNGLDKNQDNSEKLKDAHTWLLKNAQMFLKFTVLLSSIITSSKKVDLSGDINLCVKVLTVFAPAVFAKNFNSDKYSSTNFTLIPGVISPINIALSFINYCPSFSFLQK